MRTSPTNVLSVDEVPFECFHIKDVQVQAVGFHTVKFSICCSYLRLSLIEVRLSAGLAIQLLDLITLNIEQIAVVCLLI